MKKKLLAAALVAGSMLIPSMAMAQETADAPRDLAMEGLEAIGLKQGFDDLGLKLYGWVEAGYTWNIDSPSNKENTGRSFDSFRDNRVRLNQTVLRLERALTSENKFDIGGMIELTYGTDARAIHQNGLMDKENPELQFDPTQFYGLVKLPVGNGLTAKFGKFATPLGYEVIAAPYNPLFSRSFLFQHAVPFTHTGIQFDYPVLEEGALNVYAGVNRGWDQWDDNNSSMSWMLGAYGKLDKLGYFLNAITGPEAPKENTDYRTVIDGTLTYALTDQVTVAVNAAVGHEATINNEDPLWWGVATYMNYKFHNQVGLNVRAEYFSDDDSFRTQIFSGTTEDFNVLGLTAGLDIYPIASFRNLRVRPEVRWDHSFNGKAFNTNELTNQVTFGTDVILTF